MKKSLRLKSIATATVAVALLIAAKSGLAIPLTYTNTVDPFVVKSDAGTVYVTNITIFNPNSFRVDITGIGDPIVTTHNNAGNGDPGNPNDIVTSAALYDDVIGNNVGNCYVTEILDSGSDCTIELALEVFGVAPRGSGNRLADYGDNRITVLVTSVRHNNSAITPQVNAKFVTEVDYAPEPGSLILFGTGILGIAGLIRCRG